MEKRLTTILACFFLSLGIALAQTSVTGTVVSQEDGQPVIGATVRVVGSEAGTVTDIDGKFSVNAKQGEDLTVSYIGMKTVTVKASNNMKIVLEPEETALDELVVTGYGSARKLGTIAGSVATVGGEQLTNRPIANVGDAMQGQVAGLQVFTSSGEPSATSSMSIRGTSSIYANTEPLIILDGSEVTQSTFLSLNPNDIENMTVLKDASSTAIYGSRAANGVIIITTKRGKFGEAPTVAVSAQYGVSEIAGDFADMMNANQWLELQQIANPSLADNANYQAQRAYYKKYGIGTNWRDVFLGGTAPTWQVNASVRGGSETVSYLVSFNHYDADGIMDDSNMRREALRANIEANITPWLKIGSNTNLAYTKFQETVFGADGSNRSSIYNKAFAAHMFNPAQSQYEILGLNTSDYANSTFDGYGERLHFYDMMGAYDPYWVSSLQPQGQDIVRINENAFVNINPIKGLNLRSAVGLEFADNRAWQKQYNTKATDPEVFPTGSRSETFARTYSWTVTNTAEYKFNIMRKHDFTVLLGQESLIQKDTGFGVTVEGLTDNRLMLLSAATQDGVNIPVQTIQELVRNSWFGMLNYGFDNRYFVDLSIRRDGSSLFADGHRWATFGAGAIMWNITNEKFMAPAKKWLNDLQLKVSYGTTGNSGISPYMALGLVSTGTNYNGNPSTAIANPANDDLTWETVKTFNLALSGRVFNRINFDFQFYNKVTSDMLMSIPYSYTTGFSSGWGNVGKMLNRGFDFTVSADIIRNKDWYWNVSLNGNYNYNEITELFAYQDAYTEPNTGTRLEVGHPYGEFYLVRWSHVDPVDGQNVWLDKNGNETKVYSEDNAVMLGKSFKAPWSGGFNTTVSWKGLQLDLQFTGMFGRYVMNNERYFTENPVNLTRFNQTVDMLNMWQKPGDITNIPAADAEVHMDSHLLENASFVRLKMLQLSYTFPKKLIESTHFIKDLKLFFVGRNLWTIAHSEFSGYDPEVSTNLTLGDYPNTRQYSFGAQLTF